MVVHTGREPGTLMQILQQLSVTKPIGQGSGSKVEGDGTSIVAGGLVASDDSPHLWPIG